MKYKRLHALIFILFSAYSFSVAQLSIELELLDETTFEDVDISDTLTDLSVHINVINNNDEEVFLKWEIVLSDTICTPEWQYQGCDNFACFKKGTLSNVNQGGNPNVPFNLAAGASYEFVLHVWPYMAPGCCDIMLDISHVSDINNIVASVNLPISVNEPNCNSLLSADFEEILKPELFPNPFNDILFLSNGESVEQIKVYDAYGQHYRTINEFENSTLDLSSLHNGIYFINLFDKKGKLLNTDRVIKLE